MLANLVAFALPRARAAGSLTAESGLALEDGAEWYVQPKTEPESESEDVRGVPKSGITVAVGVSCSEVASTVVLVEVEALGAHQKRHV
jgi:hypothetical protein